MPQLTYNWNPAVAYEGMLADAREGQVKITRLAEGLVPVGKLCAPGTGQLTGPPLTGLSATSTSPGGVKAMTAGSNPILGSEWVGVPLYDSTRPPYDSSLGYSCYENLKDVPLLERGALYVKPEGAVIQSTDVYVRVAVAGPLNVLGSFASGPGAGLALFSSGRWISGLMQGNLAIVRIGL